MTDTQRSILKAALVAMAIVVVLGWVFKPHPSVAEDQYYQQMHTYQNYDDDSSRQLALNLCSADTVPEAKVLLMAVVQLPQVQHDPTTAGQWMAVAATYGIDAFCPENRGVAVQAMHELAGG